MSVSWITNYAAGTFGSNTSNIALIGRVGNGSAAFETTPVRVAGDFSNLIVNVTANTWSGTATWNYRNSGGNTALNVVYAAGETGVKEDTSDVISTDGTDEPYYRLDSVGTGSLSVRGVGMQFEPDTATTTLTLLGGSASSTINADSATYYSMPFDLIRNITTEAQNQLEMRGTYTASNFYVYVSANARTTNTVFGTRKNGAAGAQSVTYGSAETGAKEDTSNTDSLVATDDFNFRSTTSTGGGDLVSRSSMCTLTSSSTGNFILGTAEVFGESVNFNVTTYTSVGGLFDFTTTESQAQLSPRFGFTASELGGYVSANTIATSATTVRLRNNTADGNLVLSWAAAETGLKSDTSNSDIIATATPVDLRVATPNTSGALTFRWIAMQATTAVATTRRVFIM